MMYYKGTNLKKTDEFKIDPYMLMNLDSLGFRYKKSMSSEGDNVYEYFFPVYSYHDAISLECRFLLHFEDQTISVDVFDTGSHGIYAPWYCDESGIYNKLLTIINRNIRKEMKRLHIRKI